MKLFKFSLLISLFLTVSSINKTIAQIEFDKVELNIFPNPNKGTFYITVVNEESYDAQLFGMDGRLVKNLNLQSGLNYISINIPAGIYILKIGKEEIKQEFKVVIK